MFKTLQIRVSPLHVPLRTTFKQASSTRNLGESIWCEAQRNNLTGYGEGCPRIYVTQETVETGLTWLKEILPELSSRCHSLAALKKWMTDNRMIIDQHPAAFCAIETALLDLFAREEGLSVEGLLGLISPKKVYQYTAVLGDSSEEKFKALIQRYLSMGFTDFKVKINGELKVDQQKLKNIQLLCQQNKVANYRIRLDANNLWTGKTTTAIDYLSKLEGPFLGIEEPIEPKNYSALSQISQSLNTPIILDESLCNLTDLAHLNKVNGQFIANLKVSRIGGILRTLELIEALKKAEKSIIIGAHVGETSVLTRAGMTAAKATGQQLIAQEGGFGTILLEKDMVHPSLTLGAGGTIDLTKPYLTKIDNQTMTVSLDNWNLGWGLNLKLSNNNGLR